MPVIKAQYIPAGVATKEKVTRGEVSQGEFLRKELQHDIQKVLKSSILPEMRKLCQNLRQDVRDDLQAILHTRAGFAALTAEESCPVQLSPTSFNSRQPPPDFFVPPRSTTAPASQKCAVNHPHAVVDHFPGQHKASLSEEEMTDDACSEKQQPVDSSLSGSWVAEAWGSDFAAEGPPDTPRPSGKSGSSKDAPAKGKLRRQVTALHKRRFQSTAIVNIEQEKVSCFEAIVNHDYFDYVMSAMLLTNATMMGVQVEILATQGNPTNPPPSFRAIDITFCVIFILELTLRWLAIGCRKVYFGPDWQWGWFDTVIVGFSVAEEMFKLAQPSENESEDGGFSSFGFLRMLRIGRIVRLVRVVRLIPALKSMVYLISASMQSFLWTVVLILIMMYCFAVYFTELATDIVADTSQPLTQEQKDDLQNAWGSIVPALMSLFQAITGGDDWHNFVAVFKPVSDAVYTQNLIIFALYIAFASLVMMNLVTGVFVEGAQRIAREEKCQELQKHVRKIVSNANIDINALVTYEEFSAMLETKEFQAYMQAFGMDEVGARDIFYILDVQQCNAIIMREFFAACIQLQNVVSKGDTEILRHRMMHSISDMVKQLDSLEGVIRHNYAALHSASFHRESQLQKQTQSPPRPNSAQPVVPKSRVPELDKPQTPIPFPLPDNLSGYLLKTGSNKHMVTWLGQ